MCRDGILSQFTPARVHWRLTAATLLPATESTTTTTTGGNKRKAGDGDWTDDDDEFEAEFQLFEDDDDDKESPASPSEPGGIPSLAGTVNQKQNTRFEEEKNVGFCFLHARQLFQSQSQVSPSSRRRGARPIRSHARRLRLVQRLVVVARRSTGASGTAPGRWRRRSGTPGRGGARGSAPTAPPRTPLARTTARPIHGKRARLNFPLLPPEGHRSPPAVLIDLNLPAVSDDDDDPRGAACDNTVDINTGFCHAVMVGGETTESTLMRIKELISSQLGSARDEQTTASIVSELATNGAAIRGDARATGALQYAALICECSRRLEQVAALKRDLEEREAQLLARREQLVRLVSLALS